MRRRFGRKRRFIAPIHPQMHDDSLAPSRPHEDELPLGSSPPSSECLPDSVLALLCPRCLVILYISRGLLASLNASFEVFEALVPGQITWFNPVHTPCQTMMRQISLDEDVQDSHTRE